MDLIHLIIKGEEFYVPKTILEKAGLFKDLLEIQSNDLEIDNIDPLIFRILILILEDEIHLKKEIASLCDYINLNKKIDLIADCYCIKNRCNNISLNNEYCALHKCGVENCNKDNEGKFYCMYHMCPVDGCGKIKRKENHYCDMHKCHVLKCNEKLIYKKYCTFHVKNSYNCNDCKKLVYCACEIHSCSYFDDSNTKCRMAIIPNFKFCGIHKCKYAECDKSVVDLWCPFCKKHEKLKI